MAVPFFPSRSNDDGFHTGSRDSGFADEDPVQEAEGCVRQHPELAVWSAFGAGLLIGAAIVWVTLQQQDRTWQDELEDLAHRLRSKVGLD